jgi:hypothetical protein
VKHCAEQTHFKKLHPTQTVPVFIKTFKRIRQSFVINTMLNLPLILTTLTIFMVHLHQLGHPLSFRPHLNSIQRTVLTSVRALAQYVSANANLLDTLQARVQDAQNTKAKIKH